MSLGGHLNMLNRSSLSTSRVILSMWATRNIEERVYHDTNINTGNDHCTCQPGKSFPPPNDSFGFNKAAQPSVCSSNRSTRDLLINIHLPGESRNCSARRRLPSDRLDPLQMIESRVLGAINVRCLEGFHSLRLKSSSRWTGGGHTHPNRRSLVILLQLDSRR